jgi:hypothetical protein
MQTGGGIEEEEALTLAACVVVDEDDSGASRRCPRPRGSDPLHRCSLSQAGEL